ncbi:MAG: VWA domain-containing protein [bacterium]|nr:VWA domain-containing protein [bacterium]
MKTKTDYRTLGCPPAVTILFAAMAMLLTMMCSQALALNMDVRPENTTVLYEGDGSSAIQVRVIAPDILPSPDRPPLNLALVLDRSGSMGEEGKMEHVLQAAHMLVDRLGPDDILTIVTYNNRVHVPVSACRVTNRWKLHRIIDEIRAEGRTFLSGGLEEGFRQAKRQRRKGTISRVVLLSDGLANVGVTDIGQLRRRASSMYEDGVSVSTFGMGYDFDEDLLASMANGGGGSYHYLSRPGDIVAALTREFNMMARTSASGVEIIIRPLGGARFETAPGHSWKLEGSSAVIGLGDVSAGETRTLMAKLNVPTGRIGNQEVAEVSVRYTDPASGKVFRESTEAVSLAVIDDPRRYRESFDAGVQEKKAVIETNVLMEEAARKVDGGDRAGAMSIIRKAVGALMAAPSPEAPAVKMEMERIKTYSDKLDDLDTMAPGKVREMQKDQKYRSYQQLNQQ